MLQKIISISLIVALLIPNLLFASSHMQKDYILAKHSLSKVSGGEKYIGQIDTIADKISEDKKTKLITKILSVQPSLENRNDIRSQKYAAILNYLLVSLQRIPKAPLEISSLDPSEIEEIEKDILKVQNSFLHTLEEGFEGLLGDMEHLFHTEESGDFSLDLKVDQQELGDFHASLQMNNYRVIQNYFDSKGTMDLQAFMEFNTPENNISFDMMSFMDYISKDGNMYVLLEDLNISGSDNPEIQAMIDTFKNIAKQNTHVSIPTDASYSSIIDIFENFDPQALTSDIRQTFDKPLLTPHSKQGDAYILIPTQYACNQAKFLSKRFDPFHGSDTCSQSQYQDLVAEFLTDQNKLYIIPGKTPIIGAQIQDGVGSISLEITFDTNRVTSIDMHTASDNIDYPEINVSYEYGSHCNASWKDARSNITLQTTLDSKNNLVEGDLIAVVNNNAYQLNGKLSLKRGDVLGELYIRDNATELFTFTTSGEYGDHFSNIQNSFTLAPIDFIGSDEITGTFDWAVNTQGARNDLDMFIQVFRGDNEFINLKMTNEGKRIFKKTPIQAPANSTPLEDLF